MSGARRFVDAKPVSDGRSVRWTLEQVLGSEVGRARCDWLRFTVPSSAFAKPEDLESLSAEFQPADTQRGRELQREIRAACVPAAGALWLARQGARELVSALGGVLDVGDVTDRQRDFYLTSCALQIEGQTVAEVHAGGRSEAQASTVHFNLWGGACLHFSHAHLSRIRDFIERVGGWITRCDLAVDVFEGDDIESVRAAWLSGGFDVRGKRPHQSEHGSWTAGHSRTFQVGRRETGKLFRAYEKGDEQLGPEANDPWVRYEVELRAQGRVIDLDILTRCSDFFAGAYPFCEALLQRLQAGAKAQPIPTVRALVDKTAHAAAARVLRWVRNTAAPSVCALLKFRADECLLDEAWRTPRRLAGFARETLQAAFDQVAAGLAPPTVPIATGAV